MALGVILGLIGGLALGGALATLALQRRMANQDAELRVARRGTQELERTRDELARLQADAGALREERARLSEQLRAAEDAAARDRATLDFELSRLNEAFAAQSQNVMDRIVVQLSEISGRQGEERDRTLRATVGPVADLLQRFEQHVHEVEKDRKEAYGGITSQVESLRRSQEQLTVET
ncbi:MAG TPA: hypothetical protein VIE15_05115 [Acidimicrobiales bacterium]